jgi:hypothetical protein
MTQSEKDTTDGAGSAFAILSPLTDCIKCDGEKRDCRFFTDAEEVRKLFHPSDDDQKV